MLCGCARTARSSNPISPRPSCFEWPSSPRGESPLRSPRPSRESRWRCSPLAPFSKGAGPGDVAAAWSTAWLALSRRWRPWCSSRSQPRDERRPSWPRFPPSSSRHLPRNGTAPTAWGGASATSLAGARRPLLLGSLRAALAVDRLLQPVAEPRGALHALGLEGCGQPFVALADVPECSVSHDAEEAQFALNARSV